MYFYLAEAQGSQSQKMSTTEARRTQRKQFYCILRNAFCVSNIVISTYKSVLYIETSVLPVPLW
jgi:hypothetical protein